MSRRAKPPIFLQRASYRQRRLRDAGKLLPFIGIVLFALPLAWTNESPDETVGSSGLIYVFGVWALLIIAAAILTTRIQPDSIDNDDRSREP